MRWIYKSPLRLRSLFKKNWVEQELSEELRFHLENQIEQNIAQGMSPQEARYSALRQFGNVGTIKEECRDSWGMRFITEFLQDLGYGLRQLRRSPGFTVVAVLTLALGMAAAVSIFGFVDSVLIRPLPYSNPSRLMAVFKTSPLGGRQMGYSYPDYLDLERFNAAFASIAAYDGSESYVLSDGASVHRVNGIGVTSGFFRVLGVTPLLGTDFSSRSATEDLQAVPSTVILSYPAWQEWFGGKPDVLGKTVTLNGEAYTVIGVLPRSFQFAPTGATEFWTTLHPYAGNPCTSGRGCAVMGVVARLKNGITLQQASTDAQAISAQEARRYPDPDRNRGASVVPLSQAILGNIRPVLLALFAGAGLLLLIAYINVASLLLVRSENRRREFAVRGALGASRGRLVWQFVTEGILIVAASSALGLFAATLARRLLLKLIPADMLSFMPCLRGSGWNWHVAAFAMLLLLIACALFAMTPALRLPFTNLRAGLAEGNLGAAGTAWRRLGTRLVVLELATTMVLLAGAGLLGKSLYRLMHIDLGFVPGHLATLSILAPGSKYSKSAQAIALQRGIVSSLQSLPGVAAAGTASDLPVGGEGGTQIGFVDRPGLGENNAVGHIIVSPGYLSALQAQLLKGRYFNENDNAGAPLVAIINQTLVRRYFRGVNPIGRQFFYHAHGSDAKLDGPAHPTRIVGVIADVKQNALDGPVTPVVYTPFDQEPGPSFSVAVRTSQSAAAALPTLIATLHKTDPGIVTSGAATMPEIIQDSQAAYWHRASAWLAGGFAALALALSIVGLYGVIAYSVSRRTHEIGVRMALGASRGSVLRMILKEAGWLTLIGLVIGIPGSIVAGMLMRSLLFDVHSWNVLILGAIAAVLVTAALLASYIPARRAAKVDPMVALRYE